MVKQDFEDKVIEAATAMSQVEYPPVLVDIEVDHSLERNLRFLQNTGQNVENYLKSINKNNRPAAGRNKTVCGKKSSGIPRAGQDCGTGENRGNDGGNRSRNRNNGQDFGGDKKDELRKALQSQRNRESIEDNLVARITIQKLTEIAQSQRETKKEA